MTLRTLIITVVMVVLCALIFVGRAMSYNYEVQKMMNEKCNNDNNCKWRYNYNTKKPIELHYDGFIEIKSYQIDYYLPAKFIKSKNDKTLVRIDINRYLLTLVEARSDNYYAVKNSIGAIDDTIGLEGEDFYEFWVEERFVPLEEAKQMGVKPLHFNIHYNPNKVKPIPKYTHYEDPRECPYCRGRGGYCYICEDQLACQVPSHTICPNCGKEWIQKQGE